MAEGNEITIGFLNLVATPHPSGIYPATLEAIANIPVKHRGKDYAVIHPPQKNDVEVGIYEGAISFWTDIDSSEPSIDKSTFKSISVEQDLKKIFEARGFNNRTFLYALDNKTHKIAIELRNDAGKTLAINAVEKIFISALSKLNREGQTYEVTIIPEEDALEKVLGFHRLDRVQIVLKRPNPGDHHGADADEVIRELRELEEQNMKSAIYDFNRQPKTEGIILNEKNKTRARVASLNGYVESSGVDENDDHGKRSTREYPKIVKLTLAAGTRFASTLRQEAKRFRAG